MSKSKYKHSTLSGLVDSDEEEDQVIAGMPTPDSAAENKAPAKKGRGRPKAAPAKITQVTKATAPARRLSGRLNAKTKAPAGKSGKRPALADKTNQQHASDTEEVDDFEQDAVMEDTELEESIVTAKKPKPTVTKKKAGTAKTKTLKGVSINTDYSIGDSALMAPKLIGRATKKGCPTKREATTVIEPSPEKVIMETQGSEMEIDGDVDEQIEEVEKTVSRSSRNAAHPRSDSRHRQNSVQQRRAGSASDTERNDPALRRKLGEMTKKYESLNIKYQDLREIGLKEGERNFERLKKQSEEKTKISNDLIASLKADLAHQTTIAKESKSVKKRLDTQVIEISALRAQVVRLTASLSEVQAENKTLSTRLAANRTAAASVESAHSKVPCSVVKTNGGIRMMGTAEAAQVAQAAQLKEDIYSDLTGLIIQGVKRDPEEDIFNCLQTGRNGTLHFKLAAANEKSSDSYDDAQCSYVPQLDPSRDRALMELLPDYLVDEITFPRPQAAKFYARVVKALTERPV